MGINVKMSVIDMEILLKRFIFFMQNIFPSFLQFEIWATQGFFHVNRDFFKLIPVSVFPSAAVADDDGCAVVCVCVCGARLKVHVRVHVVRTRPVLLAIGAQDDPGPRGPSAHHGGEQHGRGIISHLNVLHFNHLLFGSDQRLHPLRRAVVMATVSGITRRRSRRAERALLVPVSCRRKHTHDSM